MRIFSLVLLGLVACSPKTTPPAAPAPEAPPPAEPAPPPPPPPPAPNADLHVTLERADGSVTEGRVVRIERGVDRYATDGWTDAPRDLQVSLESGGTAREATWSELATIDIALSDPASVDCFYDSAKSPWVYLCVQRTDTRATTTDDATWSVTTSHRWRLTFDDDRVEELHLYRLPVWKADPDGGRAENHSMYPPLQERLAETAKRAVVRLELRRP